MEQDEPVGVDSQEADDHFDEQGLIDILAHVFAEIARSLVDADDG
jgi:hypothetical protein